MVIIQFFMTFIYMCILPYLTGVCIWHIFGKKSEDGFAFTLAGGLMVQYSLYEILAVIGSIYQKSFHKMTILYGILAAGIAALGVVLAVFKNKGENRLDDYSEDKSEGIKFLAVLKKNMDWYFILGIVLIVVQILAILIYATPDADDSFYSGLSSIALSKDCILKYDAYDGLMAASVQKRYIFSALPVYQASLSVLSQGMSHLVIIHDLFPFFYIPLAYALYTVMAIRILKEEKVKKPAGKFLFFFAILHLLGNYFVFSPENFLTTRIWQGKALFVTIGIPCIYYFGSCFMEALYGEEKRNKESIIYWIFTVSTILACCFMGETGFYLGPLMLGALTVSESIIYKKWKGIPLSILACIPAVLLYCIFM